MHDGRKPSRFQASRFATSGLHFHEQHCVRESRYRHILVPTGLNTVDCEALLLGFELSSLHGSMLTLLHVLQAPKQDRIAHALDAIGLLHAAAEDLRGTLCGAMPLGLARLKLRKFAQAVVSPPLLDSVSWRGECRPGVVAQTIASYADETSADLVILSAKPSRWWLPMVPAAVRTIERRTRANVMVIRSQTPSPGAARPQTAPTIWSCEHGG